MKKFALALVITILALPALSGFGARYYLHNQLAKNLHENLKISTLKIQPGWFSSAVQADIYLLEEHISLPVQGVISHGPIIWQNLVGPKKNIARFLSLYQLDANLGLPASDSDPASVQAWVSYLGRLSAKISHLGFNTKVANTRIYGDVIQVNSSHDLNGTILSRFSGNQIEMVHKESLVYLTQLKGQTSALSEQAFPSSIIAQAISFIAQLSSNDRIELADLDLNSKLVKLAQNYQYQAQLDASSAQVNQARLSKLRIHVQADRINPQLAQFWQEQQGDIIAAINNNQFLIVLKFLTDALKLAGTQEPQIEIALSAQYDNQPVEFNFSSQILDKPSNALGPFGLLGNVQLKLKASMPEKFITQTRQAVLLESLNKLSNQGWLIRQNDAYHADIGFENNKLKVNNTKL